MREITAASLSPKGEVKTAGETIKADGLTSSCT